jgi:primosomal protein N' (replication factor Y)
LYVKVAIPRPVDQGFDYRFDPSEHEVPALLPTVGDWVEVPFGRVTLCGSVLEVTSQEPVVPAGVKLKSVLKVLPKEFSLPAEVQRLAKFAAEYYQYPVGEAFLVASPPKVNKKFKPKKAKESKHVKNPRIRDLNEDQVKAFDFMMTEISRDPSSAFLLEGVTGSGKTEVYLEVAKKMLAADKSVLILVPEIALTAQLRERFESGLGREVILWHSAVAEGLRQNQWLMAKNGEARVILGARSAIFSPIQDLGVIIVDEEHDATYKQEERFRYHARDLALYRGKLAKAAVILGSATPSLETLQRVKDKKILHAKLDKRHSERKLPFVIFISLSEDILVP